MAYLDRAGNPAEPMRLQQHIDHCERCRVLLAEAARWRHGGQRTAAEAARSWTFDIGELVDGRYEIRARIGRGGMGEVYRVWDTVLNETEALKTLLSSTLGDASAIARVKAEVKFARRVTHPNVCRIFEFGQHVPAAGSPEPVPFLTMQYLRGRTLTDAIADRGRFAPEAALPVLLGVLSGLEAIHAEGIVHRDLKSDNIMLIDEGLAIQRGIVTDFGLARIPDGNGRGSGSPRQYVAGTLDYVAPELLAGQSATPASDIYALGVVLFEMLTGKRPFSGDSPWIATANRLEKDAPLPSTLVPELAHTWDRVAMGCLERCRDRRLPNARAVIDALREQSAAGGGARPKKRPYWTAAVGLGVAFLALGGGIAGTVSGLASSPTEAAVLPTGADVGVTSAANTQAQLAPLIRSARYANTDSTQASAPSPAPPKSGAVAVGLSGKPTAFTRISRRRRTAASSTPTLPLASEPSATVADRSAPVDPFSVPLGPREEHPDDVIDPFTSHPMARAARRAAGDAGDGIRADDRRSAR